MGKCIITGKETDNIVLLPDKDMNLKLTYILQREYEKMLLARSI